MSELKEEGYPVYGANGKIGYYDKYNHEKPTLLIGCRGTCGAVHISEPYSYTNGNTMALDNLSEDVDIKFLYYHFLYRGFDDVLSGGVQKQITGIGLSQIEIPLPPMSVQKEIVEKLDKAAAIREKSKALLAHYDALAESLFIELFGDPISNEKGWEVGVLDNVAPIKKYDKDIEPDNDGKFWLLNLDMIESNTGEIIDKNMVDISEINTSTIKFSEKNVLYSKLRPYLNKVVTPIEKGYCTTELLPLFPDENILDRNFLTYLLRSVSFVKYIEEKVAGAKMPRVNMDTLRRFNIILPPLSLQVKFAEMVENIEEQKARAKAEIEQSEAVFQALLQENFG